MDHETAAALPTSEVVQPLAVPRPQRRGLWRHVGVAMVVGAGACLTLLLVTGAERTVELIYIPGTIAVGLLVFLCDRALYVAYAWWIWLLTPLVRRLVDYRLGWHPASPLLAAPLFVTAICAITVVQRLPALKRRSLFPFLFIFAGIVYGYLIGMVRNGPVAATYGMLGWLVPTLLALHLALEWQRYPQVRTAVERAILAGVFALGIYGVCQFVSPTDWDRLWMLKSEMRVIGRPEPFEVRVFSTLNSPAPFAMMMLGGLLMLLASQSRLRWPALVSGFAAFLLSLVRSAWGSWVIGVVIYWLYLRRGSRIRLGLVVGTLGLLLTPILSFGPIARTVESRVTSFGQLSQDASLMGRIGLYRWMAGELLHRPIGKGFGASGGAVQLTEGDSGMRDFDSGVLDLVYTLGWLGSMAYLIGLVWLSAEWLRRGGPPRDRFETSLSAVGVAVLSVMLAFNSLVGFSGIVFWTALGLALAARRAHRGEVGVTG